MECWEHHKFDYVFHLASAASPVAYTENPVNTQKAASLGTINTLGLARKHGAEYFLYDRESNDVKEYSPICN